MIGRIRAVVLSQCPQIETIAFEGSHRGSTTLIAEMSRLTEWRRFITFDSASQQPSCPPAVPPARCRKQAEAFVVADHLFRGNRFADTEIVNMLEPEANDLGFRSNGVVGKLRIVAHDDFVGQFSTPKQLADAIADDIANACVNDGGRPDPPGRLDLGPTLIRRFVICRASGRPDGQNVVLVWDSKDRFRVFSLLAEGAHAGEASAFAGNLIRAIQAKP
ncbi:MAG TPA: hypothetical protein VFC54_12345 [Pseudolabrys sp.]|nr:hypothetical protein [Pseudolabrys sp.]